MMFIIYGADFDTIYSDDAHEQIWGAGKYSGGHGRSVSNWPGAGGKPSLVIPASKFVVHFKTNGQVLLTTDYRYNHCLCYREIILYNKIFLYCTI